MPVVSKQSPTSQRSSGADNHQTVLDRIKPVAKREGGIKFLVYGQSKTGKTRFAATFPKPLLLMGTEDGTKSIANVKGVDFVRLRSSEELGDLTTLLSEGRYHTAVLDTAGGLQDLILKEILGLSELPLQRSWGMAERATWQVCGAQLKERLNRLLDLADRKGINVVVIAHERNFGDEGNSELVAPTVGAALTPSATGWLNGAVDYIGQTFKRAQMKAVTMKVGGKEVATTAKSGRIEYALRVGPHEVFMTGFRTTNPAELPDAVVDPTHEKIIKLL